MPEKPTTLLVIMILMFATTEFFKSHATANSAGNISIRALQHSRTQVEDWAGIEAHPIICLYLHGETSWRTIDFLRKINADVAYRALLTWGDSVDVIRTRWSREKWFIEECHRMNVKVIAGISASILEPEYFNSSFVRSAATMNTTGHVILQYQEDVGNYYCHGCLNHYVWREHLFQVAKVAIDLGVDGIEFDEPTHWWWTGECYADECIEQFKEYLQTKYAPDELRYKFGINNITTFSYREYLASKGLLYVDEQERLRGSDPLGREYYIFELITLARSFEELTVRIKEYAKKTYGKDFTIVANQWQLNNDYLAICPYVDFFSVGTNINVWYMGRNRRDGRKYGPPYYTGSPFILLGRAIDHEKRSILFVDYPYEWLHLTPTSFKIVMSEAWGIGAYYNIPYFYGWLKPQHYFPTETLVGYVSFFQQRDELFQPSIYPSDVALFAPYSDILWNYVPGFPEQIYGASQILVDAHIPFDMVFSGDGNVIPDTITINDLKKYKVVYLPHIVGLSDRQVNTLKEYVNQGGKLLITGACGMYDEMKNNRPSSPFDSLHGHQNVTYVKWESNVWDDWIPYSDYKATKDPNMRNQIFNAIKNLLGGNLIMETNASSTVGINTSFQPENNRLLVHFINYDYHIENDTVTEKENIHVKLKKPEGFNTSIAESVWFSPDFGLDPMPLKYSITGDYIEFTLPKLQTYSIALIGSIHDVSTADIKPYRTILGRNSNTSVNVTVANVGYAQETVKVSLYANTTLVQTKETSLPIGTSTDLTFKWNFTLPIGNYTLKAIASQVQNETIVTNNAFIYGIIEVSILGDINADGRANILDVSAAARAFGTKPGQEKWEANADVNEDRIINIVDIATVAREFGKSV